jgi:hypothetical protein
LRIRLQRASDAPRGLGCIARGNVHMHVRKVQFLGKIRVLKWLAVACTFCIMHLTLMNVSIDVEIEENTTQQSVWLGAFFFQWWGCFITLIGDDKIEGQSEAIF